MKLAPLLALTFLALSTSCASTVVAVQDRAVRDELETLEWRPAQAADLVGHWRVKRIGGPAAAVLLDVSYWMDDSGRFSGAALFAGPPPTYEVLSGEWSLAEGGALQLGADAEPAVAEVAGAYLRIRGTEGALVLERAVIE
ncbi:MAG TPA: hypothetical protein VF530_15040 [Planctomycetota bacterium]